MAPLDFAGCYNPSVHEILRSLPAGVRVLDLGCGGGSFHHGSFPLVIIALDEERPKRARPRCFVQADAARLPFVDASFDAIIANHSLEHIADLDAALREMNRVLKHPGKLYVAVPDSTTFTDRLYRWLARGGGHVNPFASVEELSARIRRHISEPLAAIRPLHTSLSFLNQRNHPSRPPRRLWLLGRGNERVLKAINRCLRWCDSNLRTRLSLYGWALFFGDFSEPVSPAAWTNVCVRCGAGHSSRWLEERDAVRRLRWSGRSYVCPDCGASNHFTPDRE